MAARPWRKEEIAVIREEYARGVLGWPDRAHARLPHRSTAAIKQYAVDHRITRRGKHAEEYARYYGDAPLRYVTVRLPGPLADWLDTFARQRGIARNVLYEELIDLALGMMWDWLNEEYGTTMPFPPGQQALDSPWHPNNHPEEQTQ